MRKHKHQGRRAKRARARSHPVTLAAGLLIVAALAAAAGFAVQALYTDYAWHADARAAATAVAEAVQSLSSRDDSTPVPVDAVAGNPGPGQVTLAQVAYSQDVPADVTRIRLTTGGALSVLTRSGALCSGITFNMSVAGRDPSGAFTCGNVGLPPAPLGLRAIPHDAAVTLEWQHPPVPVEDYAVSYSSNGGASWSVVDDGVSADTQAMVRSLLNGHPYLFRVAAVNLAGQSPTVTSSASPFTRPAPPTSVRATGGVRTIVSWTPSPQDGGRPVTSYIADGDPGGTCYATPPATSCEMKDLPAAPAYTFTVRAVNDAGPGAPSAMASRPVAVFSVPGRPVALTAAPGNGLALLTWTAPLQDGNTPIFDYRVEYRPTGEQDWIVFDHPPSPDTVRTVNGLRNGTSYDFQVMAVNAVGVSDPPLSPESQTPATIPDAADSLLATDADGSVLLSWSEPAFDGGAPLTDYVVQYAAVGGPWTSFEHPPSTGVRSTVTGLHNGTHYSFRVAATNDMGTGPWSSRVKGNPFGPPGPVLEPASVGSLTAIDLSWKPPADDGGRPITGYRVEYKLSSAADWLTEPRLTSRRTTATVPDLVTGEAYDFRIVALSSAGVGAASATAGTDASGSADATDSTDTIDGPTLAGVIVDETPPAPARVKAVPGDRTVTVSWQASEVGPESPIEAYTVTGVPSGTCATAKLTCTVTGLANGVTYSFTVTAANASVTGPPSKRVTATPRVFNDASGGIVSTYSAGGRIFRVHTFMTSSAFVVTSGSRYFDVLVVAGGGGSVTSADGLVSVGGGGGVLVMNHARLGPGQWSVAVGGGGAPGAAGAPSSLDGVGAAPAGANGSPTQVAMPPATSSAITGTSMAYGGPGTPTSGPGVDGLGTGGGGPAANRGGNGIVIIRYEVAR